ncbi:MAG: DUF3455 domain-containing protein [Burkholderiales bacterium]|jgi:hypothetical protein|nr:DUF3455 domain-containing protein [Burkholderiales bacterium]
MNRKYLSTLLPVVVAACASHSSMPEVTVPDNLKPSAEEVALGSVVARGVQIYECRVTKDNPQAAEWAFVAPEAELWDAQGKRVGKHYAGPHWESVDGSKVSGIVKARADALVAGAIPRLLLTTKSVGPDGAFAKVTSIQRLNTVGGVAPAADGCTMESLGKSARVAYRADYVMFVSK